MIKISVKQLQTLKACENGIIWFKSQKKKSLKLVINALLKDKHFDYARWLLKNLLTREQNQLWAINSAESVLNIFESEYPNDLRPRKAIEAVKAYLKGKITNGDLTYAASAANAAANTAYAAANAANAADAAYAADAAAYAAAYAANAADAAAYAANAAANTAYAANAAAYAAAYAANAADAVAKAAAYAADAANAADAVAKAAARREKEIKICNYALKLLSEI